jgi:hypothetical protein
MRWVGYVESMEQMKDAYKILIMRPEGKRLLGRHRSRWEENIRIIIAWEVVD